MQSTGSPQNNKDYETQVTSEMDRRSRNRRKKQSEGYTYVPIVGWYCRRATIRRKDVSR